MGLSKRKKTQKSKDVIVEKPKSPIIPPQDHSDELDNEEEPAEPDNEEEPAEPENDEEPAEPDEFAADELEDHEEPVEGGGRPNKRKRPRQIIKFTDVQEGEIKEFMLANEGLYSKASPLWSDPPCKAARWNELAENLGVELHLLLNGTKPYKKIWGH